MVQLNLFSVFIKTALPGKNLYEAKAGSKIPGPSCSKLMMSLVNDSLKFSSSDMQIF